MDNAAIAFWTGVLGFAWVFKPLWSPFLEVFPSRQRLVVFFELLSAVLLFGLALALHLPAWFGAAVALLGLLSVSSATHDIAADGVYIMSLSTRQQALWAGWQGAFFNAAKFVSFGGLTILAGVLSRSHGPVTAWSTIFGLLGGLMAVLGAWHLFMLPDPRSAVAAVPQRVGEIGRTLGEVLLDFFRKPGIWFAILFIVMFRAGEAQIQTIGPLFLRDARTAGGLALATDQVGFIYGGIGTAAFIGGSILGGWFTSRLGLRRAMLPLILAVNLPNLVFWWLASARPTDLALISGAIGVEMAGYGFGFVGVILFIMKVVAPGRYTTAHYALGTGVMQLGFVLFKMVSGSIQTAIGYEHFFLWVLACALPVIGLSFFLPASAGEPVAGSEPPAGTADVQA